ncbi:uncharacterized protein MELLADRAFT_36483 [Melampsora larici-populina 98AG31]|uniref:U6 snRNA-associated Sm-like protein LSm1 n=1 Tax=Melampsora larici-populina (strain 98AG31 / pathotype 3-4-7) TaxID=747676 RepID=F4RNU3_MELLP|nr:uncharacterized protein MELLADRAFT_36483 [Melampsora larici-populina 98AG31]EGG05805.1 hypothetical protein MELLADRAFT_36483 [Melampsora larici-populina 98AG31]
MDNFLTNVPFTTSGALVDIVDKKILVSLRDGRSLIGVLRSYDQFANLVLQDAIERIHVGVGVGKDEERKTGQYADIWRGIYLVRGENVVLLGEIDLDREDEVIERCEQLPIEEVINLQKSEQVTRLEMIKSKEKILFDHCGFGKEGDEGDRY